MFLKQAADRGSVAVVADGDPAIQRAKATALGLAQWADPIVYAAEHPADPRRLPATAYQLAARKIGVNPSRCCFVSANPTGNLAAAKSLGSQTVRVRRHGSSHAATPSGPDVDLEVSSLDDLEWTTRGLSRRAARPTHTSGVVRRPQSAASGGF